LEFFIYFFKSYILYIPYSTDTMSNRTILPSMGIPGGGGAPGGGGPTLPAKTDVSHRNKTIKIIEFDIFIVRKNK